MPEVTYIGLAAILAPGRAAIKTATIASGEDLVGKQMVAAPVKTGTLRAGIHIEDVRETADTVSVTTSTGGESSSYAIFVHEGTGPHEIYPSAAHALAWPGGAHPVKVVHHPGTRPDHYMGDPLLANAALYIEAMSRAAAGAY